MRRFPVSVLGLCAFALILFMSACGGGTPSSPTAASLTISPTVVSMNRGDVTAISTAALDKSGAAVAADFTFASSNPGLVSVSTSGNLCAGAWDANFVVCTPAATGGSAVITATVTKTPTIKASATVFVHEKVDRVELNPPASTCLSSGRTEVLTASAFSTDPAVCARLGSATTPCTIPSSTLGQFSYSAADGDVVTIDNNTNPGNVTANGPGVTTVVASVSNVNSTAQPFLVCPVASLTFRNGDTNDTAPFTLAKAATKTMNVTAVDSAGVTLTNPPVSYFSNNLYGLSIVSSATAASATVTGVNSGTTGLLFAACTPPTCNKNLTPVYSQGINGTTSGTYTAPVVYAASTLSLNLIPIDTSNNTAGTTITLPFLPNSFLVNHQGTFGILGSDSNPLMLLNATAGTVSSISGIVGAKALAISPDGTLAIAGNSSATYIIDLSKSTATVGTLFGAATKAEFSPDSRFAYFTRGNGTLYVIDVTGNRTLIYPEGATINDVAVLANGPAVYLAQAGNINVVGACNLQNPGFIDSQAATNPTMLTTLPNGTGITAIDGTSLLLINNVSISQACPPVLSESRTPVALSFSTGTPSQLAVSYDSAKAVVSSTGTQVAVVNLNTQTPTSVTLGASAKVAGVGDISADSAIFYVGGTDNTIHKIDLNANTDASQITVSLKDANSNVVAPNLVAVRNK